MVDYSSGTVVTPGFQAPRYDPYAPQYYVVPGLMAPNGGTQQQYANTQPVIAPPAGGGFNFPTSSLINNFAPNNGVTGVQGVLKQGVKSGINSLGQSLGFGNGTTAGTLGSTTSLSSLLGPAAAGGFFGGALASLTGGNPTGGSIGGAAGGALGSYAAGTAGGLAAGSAMGIGAQALNFVLPGLGVVAGGLLGGLFGKKKPKNTISEFTSIIGQEGSLNADQKKDFGSKGTGTEMAQGVFTQTNDFLTQLKKETGLDFTDRRIRGGYDKKQGGFYLSATASGAKGLDPYEVGTKDIKRITFNNDDATSRSDALKQLATHLATSQGMGADAIDKINKFTLQYSQTQQAKQNGLSGGGMVPMVAGRNLNPTPTPFSQFVQEYKNKQQQGAAQ